MPYVPAYVARGGQVAHRYSFGVELVVELLATAGPFYPSQYLLNDPVFGVGLSSSQLQQSQCFFVDQICTLF